jgi:hypothetical protein
MRTNLQENDALELPATSKAANLHQTSDACSSVHRSTTSVTSNIGIYQPFYKSALIERLDEGFLALNWLDNPAPALREFAIHRHFCTEKIYESHCLTGLFSPKFFAKTNLASQRIFVWIEANPGFDLYLIGGAPFMPYENYNGIERNKVNITPDFEDRLRSLCAAISFDLPDEFPRQTNKNYCACNYWVGSRSFWDRWSRDVVGPLSDLFEKRSAASQYFAYANYPAPQPVYLLTFIYERLVDYYVAQKKIHAIYYPWDAHSLLSMDCHPAIKKYLGEMMALVDEIDASGKWSEAQKLWLRERYSAVTREIGAHARLRGYNASETLAADIADFDLPSRYPGCKQQ